MPTFHRRARGPRVTGAWQGLRVIRALLKRVRAYEHRTVYIIYIKCISIYNISFIHMYSWTMYRTYMHQLRSYIRALGAKAVAGESPPGPVPEPSPGAVARVLGGIRGGGARHVPTEAGRRVVGRELRQVEAKNLV